MIRFIIVLLIFNVIPWPAVFLGQHMDKLERPKGISLIPKGVAIGYKGVLIAAGAKNHSDSAFLPSSSGSNMDVKLKFYPIDVGKNPKWNILLKRFSSALSATPLKLPNRISCNFVVKKWTYCVHVHIPRKFWFNLKTLNFGQNK